MSIIFISNILCLGIGILCGILFGWKRASGVVLMLKTVSDKHLLLYEICIRWIEIKQNHKSITNYLQAMECYNIGIYGMGFLGERLFYELKKSGMKVVFGIDQKADEIRVKGLNVVYPEDINDEIIDAIIVTPIIYYEKIHKNLRDIVGSNVKIISLETILYEV